MIRLYTYSDYVEEVRLRQKENAIYFSCIYLVKCEIPEFL
jgi:hypothetical protein